jgi:sialate O-acetylesterase
MKYAKYFRLLAINSLFTLLIAISGNGQITLFEDDFEHYAIGTELLDVGYYYWNTTLSVAGEDNNKYGQSDTAKNNTLISRTFTLEAGKTYNWSVSTRRTEETSSVYTLNVRSGNYVYATLELTNGTNWETNSVEFQVERGFEDVTLQIYQWPAFKFCVDNFRLVDTEQTQAYTTRLSGIFNNNMVLQRNTEVKVWGKDLSEQPIEIHTSWNGITYETFSDETGDWEAYIPTPEAGGPYDIAIYGTDTLSINNVLIGEVWLCSGQSNMQTNLKGNVEGKEEAIANSANDHIRHIAISRRGSIDPMDFTSGGWQAASPENTPDFSAVAYFFGKMLQDSLGIPIGLINASYGGSNIEAWIDKATLDTIDFVDVPNEITENESRTPTALFNGMIHPLAGYGIKGTVWYQGEANRGRPQEYRILLPAMIKSWREKWNLGDFPFYYVQIAPYETYYNPGNIDAPFWQMLTDVMRATNNTGMAITMDIGDCNDIHPAKKKPVGERLALWALAKDYGFTGFDFCGPVVEKAEIEGSKFNVDFDFAESGLTSNGNELAGFEIAGQDSVFYPAQAQIDQGNRVILTSSHVASPLHARYGYAPCESLEATLFNKAQLPASAFIITASIAPEEKPKKSLKIYPNPNSGSFMLNTDFYNSLNLKLYNPSGQEVFSSQINDHSKITLPGNLRGIYLAVLENENIRQVHKIIIL